MPEPRTDFRTYLDRTERDQLDAKAACAQQERDEALQDRDDYREARDVLRAQLDTMTEVAQGNKRHVAYLTALIERIYDDTTAEQLAQARQELAHKGTGYVPPWHGLTDHERETSTLEARNWLQAMRNLLDPTKLPPSSVPPRRAQEQPDLWQYGRYDADDKRVISYDGTPRLITPRVLRRPMTATGPWAPATTEEPPAGCPETAWDGPYSMRCGMGGSVGVCATHGRFRPTAEARP